MPPTRQRNRYILNNDGTRSPVVHQWDRFYPELIPFIDQRIACDTKCLATIMVQRTAVAVLARP